MNTAIKYFFLIYITFFVWTALVYAEIDMGADIALIDHSVSSLEEFLLTSKKLNMKKVLAELDEMRKIKLQKIEKGEKSLVYFKKGTVIHHFFQDNWLELDRDYFGFIYLENTKDLYRFLVTANGLDNPNIYIVSTKDLISLGDVVKLYYPKRNIANKINLKKKSMIKGPRFSIGSALSLHPPLKKELNLKQGIFGGPVLELALRTNFNKAYFADISIGSKYLRYLKFYEKTYSKFSIYFSGAIGKIIYHFQQHDFLELKTGVSITAYEKIYLRKIPEKRQLSLKGGSFDLSLGLKQDQTHYSLFFQYERKYLLDSLSRWSKIRNNDFVIGMLFGFEVP